MKIWEECTSGGCLGFRDCGDAGMDLYCLCDLIYSVSVDQ